MRFLIKRLFLPLLILLLTAGCGLGRLLRPPASTPVSVPAQATPTTRPIIPNPPFFPDNPLVELSLDDPAIFLPPQWVQTYRLELELAFEGDTSASVTASGAYSNAAESSSAHFETYGNGILGGFESVDTAQIDGREYYTSSATGCLNGLEHPIDYPFAVLLHPGEFLTGRANLQAVDEEISGVPAFKYQITIDNTLRDSRQVLVWEQLDHGTLYLARQDGAFLGLELSGTGRAPMLTADPGVSGEMTLGLFVRDLDSDVEIAPPDCLMADSASPYPLTPDAFNILSFPGGVTYLTGWSTEKTAGFYREAMESSGWKLSGEEGDGMLSTFFYAGPGGEKLTITIAEDPGGGATSVAIFDDPS